MLNFYPLNFVPHTHTHGTEVSGQLTHENKQTSHLLIEPCTNLCLEDQFCKLALNIRYYFLYKSVYERRLKNKILR